MWPSIIAVVGTIAGAFLGFAFQRKSAADAAKSARAEALRQERFAAYAEFAGVLGIYRRAQIDRWDTSPEDPDAGAHALSEARRQRDAARASMFRAQLLAGSESVREGAKAAFDAMDVRVATSEDARTAHDTTWSAMYRFVEIAGSELDAALRGEKG